MQDTDTKVIDLTNQYQPLSKRALDDNFMKMYFYSTHITTINNPDFKFDNPQEIIIKNEHLEDVYLNKILEKKNLSTQQIEEIKVKTREYINQFTKNEDIQLNDEAYKTLIAMVVHLIEESSKD